jgi:hypothetical protein
MPRPRNQYGSVFQYQTFDKPYKYQNFDHKSCKFTDHPIIPPQQIRFSKPRYTDYGEKSGSEAGDDPKDKDSSPPTPETEPQDTVEVIDLEDPALNDG